MIPKPKQFSAAYAGIFQDASVVRAYRYRPPYPAAVFTILAGLLAHGSPPGHVLDAGCGTGYIARPLAAFAERVDAVDVSPAMIAAGQALPGGDDARLHWICGPIETAPLRPPYALIVAAASLHWMDWERALPRFAACLTPTGFLAVVEEVARPAPWSTDISPILARYSMNRDFQPYDMLTVVQELEARGLFRRDGSVEIPAVAFRQPVGDWIEALHARNGFSRDRMDPATAAACDRELASVLLRHCPTGVVEQWIGARVIWGKPMGRSEA